VVTTIIPLENLHAVRQKLTVILAFASKNPETYDTISHEVFEINQLLPISRAASIQRAG
jgi:hypothetical protein